MQVSLSGNEIIAMVIAASFAAGINVYATLATLGLLGQAGVIPIPSNLQIVENWWVIGASLALFVIEFFADKIPGFDLIWNALQTFVRVPVAALLGYQASAQLSPQAQLLTSFAAGGVALLAHGGKTAVRAAVTPSPEPISNISLSFAEDALAIGLTWFATTHPYWAAGIATALLIAVVLVLRFVIRALRKLFSGAMRRLERSDQPTMGSV
jgi:Domain of unknown function (DUF4126)